MTTFGLKERFLEQRCMSYLIMVCYSLAIGEC